MKLLPVDALTSVGHSAQALPKNFGEGARAFKKHLDQLRQAAIEPLPLPSDLPVQLRDLEWKNEWHDEAGTVRALSGRKLEPSDHNELGCAYAVLAFKHKSDEYWLRAIRHLHQALDGEPRARENLKRVFEASGIPVTPVTG